MTIQLPPRRRESDGWDPAWGQRVYGSRQNWAAFNRKYWDSRWTLFRRCLWCRSGRHLTLNHLTYWPTKLRHGWVPLLFVVPLCQHCHKAETWLSRKLRNKLKIRYGAHVLATFGVWAFTRSGIVAALWYLLILWPGVPGPGALL